MHQRVNHQQRLSNVRLGEQNRINQLHIHVPQLFRHVIRVSLLTLLLNYLNFHCPITKVPKLSNGSRSFRIAGLPF
jgi:hypothetical protein